MQSGSCHCGAVRFTAEGQPGLDDIELERIPRVPVNGREF